MFRAESYAAARNMSAMILTTHAARSLTFFAVQPTFKIVFICRQTGHEKDIALCAAKHLRMRAPIVIYSGMNDLVIFNTLDFLDKYFLLKRCAVFGRRLPSGVRRKIHVIALCKPAGCIDHHLLEVVEGDMPFVRRISDLCHDVSKKEFDIQAPVFQGDVPTGFGENLINFRYDTLIGPNFDFAEYWQNGIAFMVLAFLVSPIGLPAIATLLLNLLDHLIGFFEDLVC